MPLSHDHLVLLTLACEMTVARDFERHVPHVGTFDAAEHDGVVCGVHAQFYDPRVLAVRLGHRERIGMKLTRELARYAYVDSYGGNNYWQVTPAGARVAADFKRSLPRTRTNGGGGGAGAAKPASLAPRSCSRCGHTLGGRKVTYCPTCGGNQLRTCIGHVLTVRQARIVVTASLLIIGFVVGAFVGACPS